MKYQKAYIYTKRTNLTDYYFHSKKPCICGEYTADHDIQLIVLTRQTDDGTLICRIKCPINPLPVKGEFEVVWYALAGFLHKDGWKLKEVMSGRHYQLFE